MTTVRIELDVVEVGMILGALDYYRGLLLDSRDTAVSDVELEYFASQAVAIEELTDRFAAPRARSSVRSRE